MAGNFTFDYHGTERATGRPIWSCKRDGAGFVGYGSTHKEAMDAFLDAEQECAPLPKTYLTGFSPFDAPERIDVPHWREDE